MFESLSDKLQDIISKTTGQSELTEENMQDALREIRRALLDADVNLRVVKSFISNIREKALGENVLRGVNPSQQLVKIVHDELVEILGKEAKALDFSGHPNLIMLLGLQGSGKTTTSAKLAVKIKQQGRNPLLVACDIYRPAAITQLKALGEQIGIEVFSQDNLNVQDIVKNAIDYAKSNGFNTLILDTAGRLQIDTDMMAELLLLDKIYNPAEKLLVIDSMTGQEAVNVAENFDAQLNLTGLILTKLDGDSRGGAALSLTYCTGKSIKYTGMGEKTDALEDFHPSRIADRILGMGDIVSLVEKAQEVFDEKTAKEMEKKMAKAEFSFNDFLKMQSQMKMFGSMDQILGMIPGLKLSKNDRQMISHEGEKQFKRIEVFIQSMTPEEREHPELMNSSRKKRIAAGSGIPLHDINQYISQFEQMRKMMKGMSDFKSLMSKNMGKMGANGAGKISMHQMMKNMRRFR
ncbi:signal recognition particle protein [bacterium]|nr:signal recognition particle protein [bacterium]